MEIPNEQKPGKKFENGAFYGKRHYRAFCLEIDNVFLTGDRKRQMVDCRPVLHPGSGWTGCWHDRENHTNHESKTDANLRRFKCTMIGR